jgi:hypothetical protein
MDLGASAPAVTARSPSMGRRALRALLPGAMVLAVVVGALAVVPAAPAGAQVASKATGPAQGFDTCGAPTSATMSSWWTSSPYTSVGIYIGGALRGCPTQPNLTPSWVSTVVTQGWRLIPIWVGPQAPCGGFSQSISTNSATATAQGVTEADGAAAAAQSLGLAGAPIYYDMEGYTQGGACSTGVQAFMSGWTGELHNLGYLAGLYSSLCSGIDDVAAVYQAPSYNTVDAIWAAAWNNTPNLFGYTSCGFSDSAWPNHQRLHQFMGAHDETWGGVTINIDTNAVDGPTAPRAASPPAAPTLTATSGNGLVHLQWTPAPNAIGIPLTTFRISRGTSSGSETTLATASGDASSLEDRTATAGTTYYYTVNASNAAGEGAASNEASATPGTTSILDAFARAGTSLVWQHFDGTTWGSWQSIGTGIAGTPASTTDATGVWVFARGADSALYFRRMSNGSWGPWTSLGTTISGDPTASTDGTGVSVFARAPDNAIWTRRYTFANGTWSAWTSLGPSLAGTPTAVSGGTGLWLFARAPDNSTWVQHYSDQTATGRTVSTWSGWSPLGGVSASDPTAVVDAAGVWVFVRGPDNALWYRRFLAFYGAWTPWASLGTSIVGTPTAAVDAGGVWVFAGAPDGAGWYRRFSNSSQTWAGWSTVGPTITSNPVVRADGGGPRVLARGLDNALWYRTGWAFGWIPWSTTGGSFDSDPVVSIGP